MVDTKALKEIINNSGKSISHLAMVLGISRTALYNKINNDTEFVTSEVQKLCNELDITTLKEKDRIFFRK